MNKKIILIGFICICSIIFETCLTPSFNSSYKERIEGDFNYVVNKSRAATITGYIGKSKEVTIPDVIKNLKVTVIGNEAFNKKGITSIIIPENVTTIWWNAFSNNNLTSIIIPDNVTYIDDSAFMNNQLTNVTIPLNVKTIGKSAFENNKLISITIPESITTVSDNAFRNNQLTNLTIPSNVKSIGMNAFARNKLTSIIIPESVTSISASAFMNNPLTSITIHENVRSIGEGAFGNLHFASHGEYSGFYTQHRGTFEKQNDIWFYNGNAIPSAAQLVCQKDAKKGAIYISKIDGITADSKMPAISYMPRGSTFSDIYLPSGLHSIEVGWIRFERETTYYSQGTVTFKHILTLESGVYDLTGELQENSQILFSIKKR